MTRLVALALVCACSSKPQPAAPVAPTTGVAPGSAQAVTIDITQVISPDVTDVMKMDGKNFSVAEYLSHAIEPVPACWTKLRGAIKAAFQLEARGAGSYFVVEGDLPREEVEACVQTALAKVASVDVTHDGELVGFRAAGLGTVYAVWRPGLVIAGSQAQVQAALTASTPEVQTTWRARLAQLPAAPMAMWRSDAMLSNLLGVPTLEYTFVFDRLVSQPEPDFAGRIHVRFTTPADAAIAARRIKQGEIAGQAPAELVAAFKRLIVKQAGDAVDIAFDFNTFAAIDLMMLQQWIASLASAAATPAADRK